MAEYCSKTGVLGILKAEHDAGVNHGCPNDYICGLDFAASIVRDGEAWVDVRSYLPRLYQRVLVCFRYETVYVGYLYDVPPEEYCGEDLEFKRKYPNCVVSHWCINDDRAENFDSYITHWMPLPDLPVMEPDEEYWRWSPDAGSRLMLSSEGGGDENE